MRFTGEGNRLHFDGDHHPVAASAVVVPENFGIAEFGGPAVKHRVASVFCPGIAPVEAVGQGLGLDALVQ